ncbi:hypothetical protein C8R43DRAFT_910924 [Mycena crocata]|nr:hypothetical protein C8R43DRAFT_910924 [Mycena crocata]
MSSSTAQATQMDEDQVVRVKELWFSSDTLVIKAENMEFRVSKSLLAARSPVFSDMVTFPQPVNGETTSEDMIDGSPVVRLHDSGPAVQALLKAIFDSSYFMPPPVLVELQVVLDILRLSHKYDVQYLHNRALQHLAVRYGMSSVSAYRAPQHKDHIIYPASGSKSLPQLLIIAAATEVDALWLLPVAYYIASTHRKSDLRAAIPFGAQTHHVQACLSAQSDLVRGTGKVWSFMSVRSDGCMTPQSCDTFLRTGITNLMVGFFSEDDLTPLDDWNEDVDWETMEDSLCEVCFATSKVNHAKDIEDLWQLLPTMFGLPTWPELDALKAAAVGTT